MDSFLEFFHLLAKKFIVWLVSSQITWMNTAPPGATPGAATDNQIISVVMLDVLILYALSPLVMRKNKRVESVIVALILWIVLKMTFEMLGGAK